MLLSALALLAGAAVAGERGALHVPSPDWRDQVVYFALVDRFDDGEPRNNDQGAGEYDPADHRKYSGGDLRGLTRRLDYIRGLGATALWITPPVANQWWNPRSRYGGYHGYWAERFDAVDPHYGTLADYRALARALHAHGMYLVQDVVVNHTADFFHCTHAGDAADAAARCRRHPDARGRRAPAQPPFDRNDPQDPRHRAADLYHWTPDIRDFTDPAQVLTWQLAGLDDLNTEHPVVRRALRKTYGDWIRRVGVDAFRVDTVFYVPAAYFRDFLDAADPRAPGVRHVARATGREDFHVFGEGFALDRAYEDTQARRIEAYARDAAGPLLPAMINFPLYGTLTEVFARGRPTAELGHRITSMMQVHADPHRMPTFVDNHDVDRFLAGGSEAALKQALLAILTLPGIPVIYYGTEQGFTASRAAMFARGYGSGGRDWFDPDAPLYRFLQGAIALRRAHPVFSRGVPRVLAESAASPGAFAYRMDYDPRADARAACAACTAQTALVVFNTAEHTVLLDRLATGLPAGTRLAGRFALAGTVPEPSVAADGTLSLVLPPRSGTVWLAQTPTAVAPATAPAPTLDPPQPRAGERVAVSGTAAPGTRVQLVVDGDLDAATTALTDATGRWRAELDTDALAEEVEHGLVAWDAQRGQASPRQRFRITRDWQLVAEREDPAGDDTGPAGRYVYPTDPGWAARQGDLRRVRVWRAGRALKVELTLGALTALWNPAHGFDHVALTLFVELPDTPGGAQVMPQQNATLPAGMRWHRRLRAHGWSLAWSDPEGATATHEGRAQVPGPQLTVDRARHTLTLTFTARALGRPATLHGARLYVSTWDYDGGFRPLAPVADTHRFGGGDGTRDPLVLDDSGVIVLP